MRFAFALALLAPLYAQDTLAISGDVANPLSLTKADLATMPRTSVTLSVEGKENTYEGVLLYDILTQAGAPLGKQLTGKALASYILAEAREIDPSFTGNKIIIADSVNSKPLVQDQGPFRLVVPGEKKAARSIRMLEKISVVRLRK
jgi:DMSO/TMAO reductase YedYZ molybdopterin-dependent catalytic subunit